MDHVIFLAQERLEALQVLGSSSSAAAAARLASIREAARASLNQSWDSLGSTYTSLHDRLTSSSPYDRLTNALASSRAALRNFRPREVYDRCLVFFVHEVTRTHVYLCAACFLVGGFMGLVVGLHVHNSVAAPQRMRAVVVNSYGGLEAITVVEDVPAPQLTARDQLLVQVKAAGLDHLDIQVAQGYGRGTRRHLNKYNPNWSGDFPVVLGRDCSGVVVAIGADVDDFSVGDEVWLVVPLHHQGTLSEYLVVTSSLACHKPQQLTMEAAAALPLSLVRAWGALQQCQLPQRQQAQGKRFLVYGGVSGVGLVLVQLICAWGGHVTTTVTSSHHAELATMLGAHDVIACDVAPLDKELELRDKFDFIINPAGPGLHEASKKYCHPDGRVVSIALPPLPADDLGVVLGAFYSLYSRLRFLVCKSRWLEGSWYGSVPTESGLILRQISPLVEEGKLRAVVDKAFNCQDAELAFAHVDSTQQVGRTVVRFRARPLTSRYQLT
ncbi:reticulon-4-interacting protein 1 homolog, mitochondrial isoform X2 [Hyalella azteca]|uniref:Reticulon-4-interacting protein 1 homolog, mitochondrial isoform X2 n=1 Tax=Hyalella azteca TaxID=294128 RepID=A0A8B7NNT8_HYAAZ|nr:reticulon-4-interacting protein 1 homolog, mitochondrial isoform X2 [Hyalella azteca]